VAAAATTPHEAGGGGGLSSPPWFASVFTTALVLVVALVIERPRITEVRVRWLSHWTSSPRVDAKTHAIEGSGAWIFGVIPVFIVVPLVIALAQVVLGGDFGGSMTSALFWVVPAMLVWSLVLRAVTPLRRPTFFDRWATGWPAELLVVCLALVIERTI
jgi:hypothetical protein